MYVTIFIMRDIIFLIGHIIAISFLATIAYRVKVWGFKSYFHGITHDFTETVSREKSIFYKINSYCLVLLIWLSPIILFAYPMYADRFPDFFETSEYFLLHLITFTIYLGAMLACFYRVIRVLIQIWTSRKDQKKIE